MALCEVHRDVGVADDLVRCAAVGLDRDADARRHERLPAADDERLAQPGDDPLGRVHRLRGARDVLEQDRELVTAETAGGVPAPAALAQALGDLDKQLVARAVTEAVVDRLEVVEVEQNDGVMLTGVLHARERIRGPVTEQRPIRKVGQVVVKGLVLELGFEPPALADIAAVDHERGDVGIGAQRDGRLSRRPRRIAPTLARPATS